MGISVWISCGQEKLHWRRLFSDRDVRHFRNDRYFLILASDQSRALPFLLAVEMVQKTPRTRSGTECSPEAL